MHKLNRILLDPGAGDGGGAATAPAPAAPAATVVDNGVRDTPNLNNAFDQLDRLMAEPATPEKPVEKPDNTTPPDDGKPAETPPPKPEEKAGDKTAPKPEKAATLRENYERLKKDLAERDSRLAKYQEMEKTGKFSDDEKKTYEEKVSAAEKRRAELEEKIKFVDYRESQDYKDKFEKPFIDSYAAGRETATQYNITDPSTGETRKATAEDFDVIMQIQDPDAAAAKIEELFGTGVKATNISNARQKVLDAHKAKAGALDEFSKKGGEMRKAQQEQFQKFQAEIAKVWKTERDAGIERLPEFFKPVEGDAKGNAALETGYQLADLAFGALDAEGASKLPPWVQERMVDGKLPPPEMAKLHAAIRNKAGAFDRVALQLKAAKAQLAEQQKQLDGFKKSSPSLGEQGRVPQAGGNLMDSVDAAIERMASR